MAPRSRPNKLTPVQKLDAKLNEPKIKAASELARRVLSHYGEPTMSLAELRAALDQRLGGVSLSELIIKDREASR